MWIYFSFLLISLTASVPAQWIDYPDDGLATMTHYTLPSGYIASCGCTPSSTYYPTAALSQMAYGSSTSYGMCSLFFTAALCSVSTPRSKLWKMLQLDFGQPSCCKPSFCAFRSQVHCCQSHRSLSIVTRWLVFCNNNKGQPVCLFHYEFLSWFSQSFSKSAGAYLNFDLAFPSSAIPADFFPSDAAVYGYKVRHWCLILGTKL